MSGGVLPLQAADHRRRGCGGLLLRFAATSTRTTPATATATATLKKSEMVRRAITGRPAGVLAEDMEGAVGAVGRLLASPHARDQEAGRTLATDLLARQPLPSIGGGAPSVLLASARCSPSVLQAIAANSPAEALAALKRMERSGQEVSAEAVNGLVRGCLDGGNAVAARQLSEALRQHLLGRGTTPDSATYALGIEAVGRCAKLPEVRALIDEVLQRSVPLDGKLLASMLTALAHKEAYDDALRLRRQLQTAHPHLASLPHAPDVQRGLISASAVKGDLRTCLEAAHELQRLMRAPPDLNTLTTILQCYSRSSLFEQEHGMLLRYLALLRSLDPARQKKKEEKQREAPDQLLASGTEPPATTTTTTITGGGGGRAGGSWQDVIHRALARGPASKAGAPSSSDPGDGALRLLEEILRSEGSFLGEQLTLRQFNPAIYALVRLGQVDRALTLVEDIQTHGLQPDIATHNTILKGFALRGDAVGAVRYYNTMLRKGVKPTTKTFEALLRAQSEVVAREVGSLQPAALVTAQLYNFDESNVLRAASPGHIQDAYSQLLLEMQAHGVKPKAQFLSSLVYGMCLTGLVEAALPLVVSALQGDAEESGRGGGGGGGGRGAGGAWLRQERADVKLFNQLLLGISLQPQPSLDMTARVLEMMEGAGVMPNQHTYTTLINVYANFTQHTAFPRGPPSGLSTRNAPELREAGREALMKALSVYFSMRRQHLREQAASPSSSARGVPTATFNSLVKLVGTEDLLGVSCHDIDHLHDELLLRAAHHDHAPAPAPAPPRAKQQRGQQQQQEEAEAWTRLPLAELQKRYAERPLPLPAYLPAERTASQMTPLELLAWRDLAANGASPDRVTYNHLIFHLTTSGRLPHAEHYLRFLLLHHHHHHHHSPPPTHEEGPSFAAAASSAGPAAQAADGSGGGGQPDFLGRQLNPKYSSYLIKQRNDRRAQFAKLLAKTPPSAAAVGTARQQQQEAQESTDVFGFDEASGAEAGAQHHHHPLFLRTLWRVSEEYLRTHRFDDFVECYRLARQSYPVSATKCFGFLLRAWRTPGSPDLVPDASAENALRQALRKHAMADPEAASPPSSAPINALFQ